MDRDIASSPLAPITVRIREACRITGIGRSKLYELIGAGEIDTIKVGAITLISVASLHRFLASRGSTA
jgi:excisionase family DNA binding protein